MNSPKVALIGLGNLAHSLLPALQLAGCEVFQLITRDKDKLISYQAMYEVPHISQQVAELREEVALIFLCLPDAQIEPVATQLAELGLSQALFFHTSGSIPLSSLASLGTNIGVFYPMQIFTQASITPFDNLPLFLEGTPEVLSVLNPLANQMSPHVYELDSKDRLRLHMGAVMVCNFTNYLYRMAEENLPEVEGMDFSIYQALIRGHIDKVFVFGPKKSQTGPAIRKDLPTLLKHLELLENKELQQDLYWEMSKLIRPDLEI